MLEPIPVRVSSQPIHPLAFLRQSRTNTQQRRFSTTIRKLTCDATSRVFRRPARRSLPNSTISKIIYRQGRAPFASALRPNLTGGALLRSAGGYSLGGGAGRSGVRHFSHTPASQAQVVHNVSAGIRAFCLNGQKAHYDGIDLKSGEKRWKAVTVAQDKASKTMSHAFACNSIKGSTLEFALSPTITALGMFPASSAIHAQTLNAPTFLDALSTDFARALQDLVATLADLKSLSTLGDLPLSQSSNPSVLKVHFPGCDARTVETLCDEFGVTRGVIREDEGWKQARDVEMALLFPFADDANEGRETYFEKAHSSAPCSRPRQEDVHWQDMLSPSLLTVGPRKFSTKSLSSADSYHRSLSYPEELSSAINPWAGDDEGSMRETDHVVVDESASYEGMEGILRFIELCDGARR